MWRDYSSSYLRQNRSAGMAVAIATLVSALLLSQLLGLFYNAWKYEIERIELEEGGWQSRIIGTFDEEELASILRFPHVEDVVVHAAGREPSIDLYFDDMRAVLRDTPRIAARAGAAPEGIVYHHALLSMYLVRDPQDAAPRLLFPLFLLIAALASASLILIIHSAFAVTMNARIHQFGILSSIGATPRQIRACLMQEAAALCALPILAGNLLGIGLSRLLLFLINRLLGSGVPGRHAATFGYHPLVWIAAMLLTVATIWISAWLPARKLSRLPPLEAIRKPGALQLKRRRESRLLSLLFGMEGQLAGGALKAQRKALRTASLSLVLSLLAFSVMQSFFALSGISTRETYFERYQGVWDVMVTLKDSDVDDFDAAGDVRRIPGVRSAIAYQRAAAKRIVTADEISDEMKAFGGFAAGKGTVSETDAGWIVNAPIVILDDASFLAYCKQVGVPPSLDGAILWNRIRDATNPDFRHPRLVPYLRGARATSALRPSGGADAVEVPVLAYAEEVPPLREAYGDLDHFELVHFLPASLWQEIKGRIGGSAQDFSICVLGREGATLEELRALQAEVDGLLSESWAVESENRIQEAEANDVQIRGMTAILGGLCALLAIIGVGNVFSNTLGFVRQRRREFARYMSVGMTPGELRKMFCVEGLAVAVRPVLIALPLAAVAVGFMLRASYVDVETFLAEAPLAPIARMVLAIWAAVALAYALGWRGMRRINLAEVLRDDTML